MMSSAKQVGRIIAALLLAQMIGGYLVNFVLMGPVFDPPGFMVNAAGHSLRVGLSVLVGIATGMLTVGIAITAFRVFREYSHAMALWFVALSVVSFSLNVVENTNVMSLLSLSEAYAKAGVADRELFQALRGVVASARNWAHYIALIIAGCTLFVFYSVLFRFALVPRALAAFGLGAVMLQIIAVAMPLFGQSIVFLMLLPLGLSQLILALWLMAKGLPGFEQLSKGSGS
jgi:Domain of unknown function (DUF4386)